MDIITGKRKCLSIFMLCMATGCLKEDEVKHKEIKITYDRYEIELSSAHDFLKVTHYTLNRSDHTHQLSFKLDYTQSYQYLNNLVLIVKSDAQQRISSKTYYPFHPGTMLVDNSIDSFFEHQALKRVINCKYYYDSGYYKTAELFSGQDYDHDTVSGSFINNVTYTIENGNAILVEAPFYSAYYQYNDTASKLDIVSFLGDYCGKRNRNLVKSEAFNSGFLNTSYSGSEFDYELDQLGFVTKRTEKCFTDHVSRWTGNVTREYEMKVSEFIYIIR